MLREDHPVLDSPRKIDFSQSTAVDVPDAWKDDLAAPKVRVLPLVRDVDQSYQAGWCTYTYEHLQAPELEIICGGVNAKTPKASAIWRQGHLLHFGFEQSPEQMNDNGRALLVNSICYVARFHESRPIIRRSSEARLLDRGAIDRLIRNERRELAPYLDWFFAGELRSALSGKTREQLTEWYEATRAYLKADESGKFIVDEQAQRFGVPPASDEFIPAAIGALRKTDAEARVGRDLLQRYVPSGPGELSADDWQAWWDANQSYLFFSDSGGYRWYVDQLAKRRKIPTHDFRGQARAAR